MSDPCCWACRSPTGVCLARYACEHHRVAEAQDEARHQAGRTIRDPTGDTAIRNIMRGKRAR